LNTNIISTRFQLIRDWKNVFKGNNIGCDDDDDEEEVDSDDMEYTEDAIDNMILEFSGD
jgi:hypothetical protein